jgi:hypothetical protein
MITYWRSQALSSLLALCGVCSGGFCCARPVGGARLQRPLGRPKSSTRRVLCRNHYFISSVFKESVFILAVVFGFCAFRLSRPQLPKNNGQNFWWAQKFCPRMSVYHEKIGVLERRHTELLGSSIILTLAKFWRGKGFQGKIFCLKNYDSKVKCNKHG